MDLTISTSQYEFTLDGIFACAIDCFLLHELKTESKRFKQISITRKEVKKLLDYIATHVEMFYNAEYQSKLYDKIYNMWILMNGKEKMRIKWW